MRLTEIDFQALGHFREQPASFQVDRFHLPAMWDYVYTNRRVLLRIRHNGTGYLQIDPPGGPGIFHTDRTQTIPMFMTWLIPHDHAVRGNAFTNFWMPTSPQLTPGSEPEKYTCAFSPQSANYDLRHDGWQVQTDVFVPPRDAAMVMTISICNAADHARSCTVMPAMKPMLSRYIMAPWDLPHWYQTLAFCGVGRHSGFWMQIGDPGGEAGKRFRAAIVTDLDPTSFETCHDRFVGGGYWTAPQAVKNARLFRDCSAGPLPRYGQVEESNATLGQPIAAVMAKDITLAAGQRFQFTLVVGSLQPTSTGKLPAISELTGLQKYFAPARRASAMAQVKHQIDQLCSIRSLHTPDEALNRYTNEWLPLQLHWVMLLDRGWPTGMRGTRDCAQDATGMVPLDPLLARERLLEIMACQRKDGWFPNSYAVIKQYGHTHSSNHVDAGVWVWEFLYQYLCYTHDFAVLHAQSDWLESPRTTPVLEHVFRLFDYFLAKENIGEHGLCKIREGDWNDSVNRAGVLGRGETIMVTCQFVLALEQAAATFQYLHRRKRSPKLLAMAGKYHAAAATLRHNLNRHALNKSGFYNAVFTDAGQWCYSDQDPDGKKRVNGPANSFAIIAGIPQENDRNKVFKALNSLKGPYGWRLYHPPTGVPPIKNLGRIASGDLAAGMYENGAPYNHGSHGFLARAACAAGRGDLAYQVLRWMLPFYQDAHPVLVSRTAPYGVVNHWKEAIGLKGTGGDTFLSGSITTALRNIYDGILGFRPGLDELVIDPVIPANWDGLDAEVPFRGGRITLSVANPQHVENGVAQLLLDGKPVGQFNFCPRLGRVLASIPLSAIKAGRNHAIQAVMGRHSEAPPPKIAQRPSRQAAATA